MTLAELLATLPPREPDDLPFSPHLLGAFRRKSITFATGVTDETTIVYWFQSRSFTIDLRLPDGAATAVADRQGWIGDTLCDAATGELSWRCATSYQPCNQWPEAARLVCMGNSVIELAPSGAYVEDWRQQVTRGPLLGLRLVDAIDTATGERTALDGGLIVAGDHAAFALSRPPEVEQLVRGVDDVERALADGVITAAQVERYEVSVACGSDVVRHTTQPARIDAPLFRGDFALEPGGAVTLSHSGRRLRFAVDCYSLDFGFGSSTDIDTVATAWFDRESEHLLRHAVVAR